MTATPTRSLHINTERTWRGGEQQTLLLITGLRARGENAELICPPGSPLEERARAAGVPVHPIPMRGEADLLAVARVRRVMRSAEFQICQMHTSHAHAIGVLARGWRREPRTLVTRRVDFSIHKRGRLGLNALKYRFGVDRYIAISRAIREVMIRDGIAAERIAVVHSGVAELPSPRAGREAIRRRHGIADDAVVIGNVAHLAAHKGHGFLIGAAARLRDSHPRLRVLIVGEGDERPRLEAQIEEAGIGDLVTLVGFQEDVAGYLGSFDIFAMPSLQEGLCTSNLDALRARLPVVASDTGGIPEAVRPEETGLLARPGDTNDLADQLGRMLSDPEFARACGARGRELVLQEFSVDRTIEQTLEIYRELIARTD